MQTVWLAEQRPSKASALRAANLTKEDDLQTIRTAPGAARVDNYVFATVAQIMLNGLGQENPDDAALLCEVYYYNKVYRENPLTADQLTSHDFVRHFHGTDELAPCVLDSRFVKAGLIRDYLEIKKVVKKTILIKDANSGDYSIDFKGWQSLERIGKSLKALYEWDDKNMAFFAQDLVADPSSLIVPPPLTVKVGRKAV